MKRLKSNSRTKQPSLVGYGWLDRVEWRDTYTQPSLWVSCFFCSHFGSYWISLSCCCILISVLLLALLSRYTHLLCMAFFLLCDCTQSYLIDVIYVPHTLHNTFTRLNVEVELLSSQKIAQVMWTLFSRLGLRKKFILFYRLIIYRFLPVIYR